MIKVSLSSRSPKQLDLMESKLRRDYHVQGPTETGPRRNGKHRRFLTVLLPDPPPEGDVSAPCTFPPLTT